MPARTRPQSDMPRVIRFREYEQRLLEHAASASKLGGEYLSDAEGELVWRLYGQPSLDQEGGSQGSQFIVEYPSALNGGRWQLTAQGWVGHMPVSPELTLVVEPKIDVGKLFAMWETAFDLKAVEFPPGFTQTRRLDELYSQLARHLATRVVSRAKRGFYRAYRGEDDRLDCVRGRVDLRRVMDSPWETRIDCHYEEHTPDVDENKLLTWTLFTIARSGICSPEVLPVVRQAYRTLQSFTTLSPYPASACRRRRYDRLNADYEPLHALAWFFLANSGPHHQTGATEMVPFMFFMPDLFELFVARWLDGHCGHSHRFRPQEPYTIDRAAGVSFAIDLVLRDASGTALCVADTKYKKPPAPAAADVAQVVAYAAATGCNDAILIYPGALQRPLAGRVGTINVRSLVFDLSEDLDVGGHRLLAELSQIVGEPLLVAENVAAA